MKNGTTSRLGKAKGTISEQENRSVDITYTVRQQGKKRVKKTKQKTEKDCGTNSPKDM